MLDAWPWSLLKRTTSNVTRWSVRGRWARRHEDGRGEWGLK